MKSPKTAKSPGNRRHLAKSYNTEYLVATDRAFATQYLPENRCKHFTLKAVHFAHALLGMKSKLTYYTYSRAPRIRRARNTQQKHPKRTLKTQRNAKSTPKCPRGVRLVFTTPTFDDSWGPQPVSTNSTRFGQSTSPGMAGRGPTASAIVP